MAMEYRGYDVKETGSGIEICGVMDFDPVRIFECGQCFRWIPKGGGIYRGVVRGRVADVSLDSCTHSLYISGATYADFRDIWFDYLDLGRDYAGIMNSLRGKDGVMAAAVDFGSGLRILKQDFSEVLVSYIISANNAIPRIMATVRKVSELYGDPIPDAEGEYAFPGLDRLSACSIDGLRTTKAGFRCGYIIKAAGMMRNGCVDTAGLASMPVTKAREELMKLPGVGPKVADCVLLYSGTRYDVFPTDVWVKRVMEELYFRREAGMKEIEGFASGYFGGLAGFAQLYLFHYARKNRIGLKK